MTWWPRVSNVGNNSAPQFFDRVIIDRTRNWVQPTNAEIAAAYNTTVPDDPGAHVPGGPAEIAKIMSGPWKDRLYGKYMYSADYSKIGCWGMSSEVHQRSIWAVFPGFEGQNDGPSKNDLTQYVVQFQLDHYHGSAVQLHEGQKWAKVIGPFLMYANCNTNATLLLELSIEMQKEWRIAPEK